MQKGIKFRIYPNKEQQNLINQTLGCCRLIYNKGLAMRNEAYESGNKIGYAQTSAMLTELKKCEDFAFLKVVDSIALQQSLRDLDRGFVNFFQKRAAHPTFKSKHNRHALEGFRVRALHYLVKPYNEKEISTLLDEILSRIPDSGKYIDVKVNGSNIQIPFKNIIYAEHFSHMIHIHTTGGKEMLTRQSFEAFTASLKMDSRFYSCNRGIVINLEHAVDFDGSMFLMDDDNNIPVSRKLLKNARQTFMEFLFQ